MAMRNLAFKRDIIPVNFLKTVQAIYSSGHGVPNNDVNRAAREKIGLSRDPPTTHMYPEYIKGIPYALVEAARIDGASYYKIFRWIILPMSVPIATTVAILNITGIWNEFALINILVSKTQFKSLPLGMIKFSGSLSSDWGKQFAALTIGTVPMLAFYFVFRRQITQGVAAGAVKG